jgi:hypothetical protein
MQRWVDRFPGLLEYELQEFEERGLTFELDEELLDEQGRVVLTGTLPHEGTEIPLQVHYPDLFPYLRPEIVAPGLELSRHQNPFERNLCLLDRSTRAWSPSFTAAWLVAEQVPYLLSLIDGDPEEMRQAEAPQGEPVSAYFHGVPGAAIFIPQEVLDVPSDARAGSGRIACSVVEPPQLRLRGLVAELVEKKRNRKTRTLARADEELAQRFSGKTLSFRWARVDELPASKTAEAVFEAIDAAQPGFASPPRHSTADGDIAVAAMVIEEEVEQGRFEDAWVFAVRARLSGGATQEYLIRGERLSRADLATRLPAWVHLTDRRIALVGLGALGAEVGLELAKAGTGELRGLDFDHVEAGTIVRWTTGLSAVGHLKTDVMKGRVEFDYPFSTFVPFSHQLGGSARIVTGRSETELDVLDRFLDGAHLVIDASAEIGVQQVVAALADERELPQLYVSATEGARGGLVARVAPGRTGCWLCLQWHLEDGSIPLPAREAPPTLQPRGCASLTFTGAGFDLLPIAAQATRVAATVLENPGQPPGGPDVFVCSLPEDPPLPPIWSTHPLDPHPKCPACSKHSE